MDVVFDVLQSFTDHMNAVSFGDIVVALIASPLLVLVLVFVHEAGHALMAWILGHEVREFRVGDDDTGLTIRWRAFTLRLGPITGQSDFAGYILYDGSRARAWHVLLIALAGPLASFAAGLAAGLALIAFQSYGFILMVAMLGGLEMGVANLSPQAGDGRHVREAWRVLRSPAKVDPNEATSVPPPGY